VDLPDELLTVNGDKTRLVQVIANILHNAAKFTAAGGQIVLTARQDRGQAVIVVKDTGAGIPAEVLPTVFDLFTKAHEADSGQGGLGIGLALVRRLVEMHEGTVEARSDGPGLGAEFTVRLPVAMTYERYLVDEEAEARPVPHLAARRVLIADDNLDAAEALSSLLETLGHDVRVAHDGAEALALGDAFEPEVVLLDLGMPIMDGLEAARRMRQQPWGQRATLVAVTGWGQQRDRERTAEAGFDAHMVKPLTDLNLLHVLMQGGREALARESRGQQSTTW
jgi:CheY-like chemotaxis protein/anti-sigma regulatory factor (Ser/Thr protein kinase)